MHHAARFYFAISIAIATFFSATSAHCDVSLSTAKWDEKWWWGENKYHIITGEVWVEGNACKVAATTCWFGPGAVLHVHRHREGDSVDQLTLQAKFTGQEWKSHEDPSWNLGASTGFHVRLLKSGDEKEQVDYTLNADFTPPAFAAFLSEGTSSWSRANIVRLVLPSIGDSGSGVLGAYYNIDGGDWQSIALDAGLGSGAADLNFASFLDGVHSVNVIVTDKVNNQSVTTLTFLKDTLAPKIVCAPSTTGWTNAGVWVDATAHDGEGSGVNSGTWSQYGNRHYFEANGTYSFEVADNAGNVGRSTIFISNIDKIAPTITVVESPSEVRNGWHLAPISLTPTYSDSGPSELTYASPLSRISDISHPGSYFFKARDGAGNETTQTIAIQVDCEPPFLELDPPFSREVNSIWTNSGSFSIGYKLTDQDSLVVPEDSWYTIDTTRISGLLVVGSKAVIPGPFPEGKSTVTISSKDNAGWTTLRQLKVGYDPRCEYEVAAAELGVYGYSSKTPTLLEPRITGEQIGTRVGVGAYDFASLELTLLHHATNDKNIAQAPLKSFSVTRLVNDEPHTVQPTRLLEQGTSTGGAEVYKAKLTDFTRLVTGHYELFFNIFDEAGNTTSFLVTINYDKTPDPVPLAKQFTVSPNPLVSGKPAAVALASSMPNPGEQTYFDVLGTAWRGFSAQADANRNVVILKGGVAVEPTLTTTSGLLANPGATSEISIAYPGTVKGQITAKSRTVAFPADTDVLSLTMASMDGATNLSAEKPLTIVAPLLQDWSLKKEIVDIHDPANPGARIGVDVAVRIVPVGGEWAAAPSIPVLGYSYRQFFVLKSKNSQPNVEQRIEMSNSQFVITSSQLAACGYNKSADSLAIEQYWVIDQSGHDTDLYRNAADDEHSTIYMARKSDGVKTSPATAIEYKNFVPQVINDVNVGKVVYLGPEQMDVSVPNVKDPEDDGLSSRALVIIGSNGVTYRVPFEAGVNKVMVPLEDLRRDNQIAALETQRVGIYFSFVDSVGAETKVAVSSYVYDEQRPQISEVVWPSPAMIEPARFAASSTKVMNTTKASFASADTGASGLSSVVLSVTKDGAPGTKTWDHIDAASWSELSWDFGGLSDSWDGTYHFELTATDRSNNTTTIGVNKSFDQTAPEIELSSAMTPRIVGADGLLDLGIVSDPVIVDYRSTISRVGLSEDNGVTWRWNDAMELSHVILDWSSIKTNKASPVTVRVVDWAGNYRDKQIGLVVFDGKTPAFSLTLSGLVQGPTQRWILADSGALRGALSDSTVPSQANVEQVVYVETQTRAGEWSSRQLAGIDQLATQSWANGSLNRVCAVLTNVSGKTQTLTSQEFYVDQSTPSAVEIHLSTASGRNAVVVGEPLDVGVSGGSSDFSLVERELILSQRSPVGTWVEKLRVPLGTGQQSTRVALGAAGSWKIHARAVNEGGRSQVSSESQVEVAASGWVIRGPAYATPGQRISLNWNGGSQGVGQHYQVEVVGSTASGVPRVLTRLESESTATDYTVTSDESLKSLQFRFAAFDKDGEKIGASTSLPTLIDQGQLAITEFRTAVATDGSSLGFSYSVLSSSSGVHDVSYLVEKVVLGDAGTGWAPIGDWKELGSSPVLASHIDLSGAGLVQGDRVRVHLMVTDGTMRSVEKSSGWAIVDLTAPPVPSLEVQEEVVRSDGVIHAGWMMSALDPETGVDRFEWGWYVAGKSTEPAAGHWNQIPVTGANWQTSMSAAIPLSGVQNGEKVVVVVRAVNGAGRSSVAYSAPVLIDDHAPQIGEILLINQSSALLSGWSDAPQSLQKVQVTSADQESEVSAIASQLTLNGVALGAQRSKWTRTGQSTQYVSDYGTESVPLDVSAIGEEKVYRVRVQSRDAAGNTYGVNSFGIQVAPPAPTAINLALEADPTHLALSWSVPLAQAQAVSSFQVRVVNRSTGAEKVWDGLTAPALSVTWGSIGEPDVLAGEGDIIDFSVRTQSRSGRLYPVDGPVPTASISVELSPPVLAQSAIPLEAGVEFWRDGVNGSVQYLSRTVAQIGWRAVDADSGAVVLPWTSLYGVDRVSFDRRLETSDLPHGRQVKVQSRALNGMGVWSQVFETRPIATDQTEPEVRIIDRNNRYNNTQNILSNLRVNLRDSQSGIVRYRAQLVALGSSLDAVPESMFDVTQYVMRAGVPDSYENLELSIKYDLTDQNMIPEGDYRIALLVQNGTGHWFRSWAQDVAGAATVIHIDRTLPKVLSLNLAGSRLNHLTSLLGLTKDQYIVNEIDARELSLRTDEPVIYHFEPSEGLAVVEKAMPNDSVIPNDGNKFYMNYLAEQSIPSEPSSPAEFQCSILAHDRAGNVIQVPLYVRYNLAPVYSLTSVNDTTPAQPVGLSRYLNVHDPEWDFPMVIEWTPEVGAPTKKWVTENKDGSFFTGELLAQYFHTPLLAQQTTKTAKLKVTDRWQKSSEFVFDVVVHNTHWGPLYTSEYWSNTHTVEGTITVGKGLKLTVAPQATVIVTSGRNGLDVEGELEAGEGAVLKASAQFSWDGIVLKGKGVVGSAQIRDAERALAVFPGANLVLNGTWLHDNQIGLHVFGGASADANGAIISGNKVFGVKEDSGGRPVLRDSTIQGNLKNYYSWDQGLMAISEVNRYSGNSGNTGE